MNLTLGFSPCPNDTFIFDALVNKKIDTGDLSFDVVLEDVQTLNQWAIDGRLDCSKISYGVLPLVVNKYLVLNAGGALGKGVGPLLIAKEELTGSVNDKTIAIPGQNTTAHLLFSLAYPLAKQKQFMLFSGIEQAVIDARTDLGVIIHENRFTYMNRGLTKVVDLGEYWETVTNSPIPLGGIVMKRTFENELQHRVDQLIGKSVEYALKHYPQLSEYVKQHAQEMEEDVMRQHIDLYVNDFSIALGKQGKAAVQKLLEVYQQQHRNEQFNADNIFVG